MRFRRDCSLSREHLGALLAPLAWLDAELPRVESWGDEIAAVLMSGGRLLAAGNGGSAAEAQHLTAELVGRYRDERVPLSAIALHAETSSLTAIGNDYGPEEAYARQVRAHGRPGDLLLAISCSGSSRNVIAAAEAARECDMTAMALTGPPPNELQELCDDCLAVEADTTATVQEIHLVVVHLLCAAVDRRVAASSLSEGVRS
ncbi:MAG: SIS domain-containing protein [Thermoleophilaceae bacterium]